MLGILLSFPAFAAEAPPLKGGRSHDDRADAGAEIEREDIEPAVADRVASTIARKNAEGAYASAAGAQAFSSELDLRESRGDKHFGAELGTRFRASGSAADLPCRSEMDEARNQFHHQKQLGARRRETVLNN